MINPISPQFVYVIHKDKERELLREIEMIRVAKERNTFESSSLVGQMQNWFAQISQWMNANLFNRNSESKPAASQQEPCPTVPC